MKEVKAYVCSYCGDALTTDYNFIVEHEKRCFKNPNRQFCDCALCVYGKKSSYDTTNRFGQPISKRFFKCTISAKFEDFYNYCPNFERKFEEEK